MQGMLADVILVRFLVVFICYGVFVVSMVFTDLVLEPGVCIDNDDAHEAMHVEIIYYLLILPVSLPISFSV